MKKYSQKVKPNSKNKTILLIITIVILAVSLGLVIVSRGNPRGSSTSQPSEYTPPTQEEKDYAESVKDQIVEKNTDSSNVTKPTIDQDLPPNNNTPSITIVDANQYGDVIEVRAYVQGVYGNGICTITLTLENNTVKKEVVGNADASTTICAGADFSRSEFARPGEWEAAVSFRSGSTSTTSLPQKVIIK